MADALRGFAAGNPARIYKEALGDRAVSPAMRRTASLFPELRSSRHLADYDLDIKLDRQLAFNAVSDAAEAITLLAAFRSDEASDDRVVFLALLFHDRLRGRPV